MRGFHRSNEKQVSLQRNPYRADIVTNKGGQQVVETVFRPEYDPDSRSPLGWRMTVPKSATVISHSSYKGTYIAEGSLADEHVYVNSYGSQYVRELNPEVAHVTALCLDPLYTAQRSLRQLFIKTDHPKLIWNEDLDPLQQQLAEEVNARPLVRRDSLTSREERQVSYMLAAEKAHQLLDYFSAPAFVGQAIAVAGGLDKVSEEVVGDIQGAVNEKYIQKYIQDGIDFATLA